MSSPVVCVGPHDSIAECMSIMTDKQIRSEIKRLKALEKEGAKLQRLLDAANPSWTVIANESANAKSNPRHTAPQLKDPASMLYPFVNKGPVDVSGLVARACLVDVLAGRSGHPSAR